MGFEPKLIELIVRKEKSLRVMKGRSLSSES
jgi:hypothetical protein